MLRPAAPGWTLRLCHGKLATCTSARDARDGVCWVRSVFATLLELLCIFPEVDATWRRHIGVCHLCYNCKIFIGAPGKLPDLLTNQSFSRNWSKAVSDDEFVLCYACPHLCSLPRELGIALRLSILSCFVCSAQREWACTGCTTEGHFLYFYDIC